MSVLSEALKLSEEPPSLLQARSRRNSRMAELVDEGSYRAAACQPCPCQPFQPVMASAASCNSLSRFGSSSLRAAWGMGGIETRK